MCVKWDKDKHVRAQKSDNHWNHILPSACLHRLQNVILSVSRPSQRFFVGLTLSCDCVPSFFPFFCSPPPLSPLP